MASTTGRSEPTDSNESPLTVQEIIKTINNLRQSLQKAAEKTQKPIRGTTPGADKHKQDGPASGDVSHEIDAETNKQKNNDETNKQEEDVIQEDKNDKSNKQEEDVIQEDNNDKSNKQEEDVIQKENNYKSNIQEQDNNDEGERQEDGVNQQEDVIQEDNNDKSNKQEQDNNDEGKKQEDGVNQQEKNYESNRKDEDASNKKSDESNKKDEDATKKNQKEQDARKEVFHELEKLQKELQYMISSFKKLEKFESNLRQPLRTLKDNVNDIVKDLGDVTASEVPKQIPLNLRVLRNNITRVKIQIPLQHQTANTNSEANRWQTTVATREADLPYLYGEATFEDSYYFKEIQEKYHELDDREKLCLLCFAIFPENAEIKKRLLRFWWVGENLLPVKEEKEEMELLDRTIQTFVEKGLIEAIQKKNKLHPRSYKMNPIVRSCLIKFAKEAGFFDYDSEGKPTMDFSSCKKACMVKSGASAEWFSQYLEGVNPAPEEEKQPSNPAQKEERLPSNLVKLQMLFNFPERKTLEEASKSFHELQTLFNISKQFPALPKEWFSKMTGVKVVYLGTWESASGRQRHIEVEDTDFLKGFKHMKKLRLLSLQGISGITKLPSSLCKLDNLRILDLRGCHNLLKLPDRIGSLKKLTYLDLSECYLLDEMPKQLKQLEELQVFKGFVISKDPNSCTLKDLSELKKLRKLSVSVNDPKFEINDAEQALSKFENLQKLKIAWSSGAFVEKNSTQNSSEQQSDPSNPKREESKKQGKDAAKQKAQNQVSGAVKSSTGKRDKGEENGNRESSAADQKSVEANFKPVNQEEGNKMQEQTGSDRMASTVKPFMLARKFKLRIGEEKRKKPKGLGRLQKLDLQCFPGPKPPTWLTPAKLYGLKNLSIRGGSLRYLNQQGEWDAVKTLRLKYLLGFKMNWKQVQKQFPKLEYLEKVRCPRITFCPCDARGVWQNSPNSSWNI